MRRALTTETIMTLSINHLHAEFDRYPHFLSTIRHEFPDDCVAIADEIIDAELGDFCWDSRIAERSNGIIQTFEFDESEECQRTRTFPQLGDTNIPALCCATRTFPHAGTDGAVGK